MAQEEQALWNRQRSLAPGAEKRHLHLQLQNHWMTMMPIHVCPRQSLAGWMMMMPIHVCPRQSLAGLQTEPMEHPNPAGAARKLPCLREPSAALGSAERRSCERLPLPPSVAHNKTLSCWLQADPASMSLGHLRQLSCGGPLPLQPPSQTMERAHLTTERAAFNVCFSHHPTSPDLPPTGVPAG